MKNTIHFFGIACMLTLASCGQTKVEETKTTLPPVNTETTVKQTQPKAPETNSTEIQIGKDGGKIETNDGNNKTKIEISKKEAEITIKK